MIVRKGLDLSRLLRYIGPSLALLLAYDVVVTGLYVYFGFTWVSVPQLPLPLLGSAIALILTLRNNAAYGRWWEARSLWGAVVNNSRSLARASMVMAADPALVASLVRHQIAYALALRCHLLRQGSEAVLAQYLPGEAAAAAGRAANVPAAIQFEMGRRIAAARAAGLIDSIGAASLDSTLGDLANAQGGLERIKNTPLPRQYSHLPQVFTRIYCILLPIGLVADLGLATPIGSTVIGFMFLALDRIGGDLEDPFGNAMHDIPMAAIVRGIEIDLLQAIGSETVPAPATPEHGILW